MSGTPVAAVTGASRNIGRAVAATLARDGYDIACFGRDVEALRATAGIIEAFGRRATVHVGDAGEDDDLIAFAAGVGDEHGRLDVLVNNAGISHEAAVVDTPPATFRKILNVNLTAFYTLSREAHSLLSSSSNGVIVNIGSMFGSIGVPGMASYCTSKAGIEGLTRALAIEWAVDGIRVVCLAPGYVESDISRDVLDDEASARRVLRRIPLRRVAQPEEVGEFVSFLASRRASFLTGETIVLDGGQRTSI